MMADNIYELVSVIVPVYNSEIYLRRCLDSILQQTYKNIEVIIINDGSTDNSLKICESYKKTDNRVKIINQENSGSTMARYNALQKSRGGYISCVDSDDWIEPNTIEIAMESLTHHAADLFIFNYEVNGKPQGIWNNAILNSNHEILLEYYEGRIHNKLCNKVVKKELYTKTVFPCYQKRDIKEDADIMSQVLLYANKAIRAKECLYHYTMIEESLSHKKNYTRIELAGACRNEFDKMIRLYEALPEKRATIKDEISELIKEQIIQNIGFELQGTGEVIEKFYQKNKNTLKNSIINKVVQMNYCHVWWYVLGISLLPGKNHSTYNAFRMIKNMVKKR